MAEMFKIFVAFLCLFTARVAGFEKLNFGPLNILKSLLKPKPLDTIILEDFVTITGMFPGCNLYIISPHTHVAQLDKVSQPRMYYTDYDHYLWDYFKMSGQGTPFIKGTKPKLEGKTGCKVEIVIDWVTAVFSGKVSFTKYLIQDIFTLEPQIDSNFIYQVLIASPEAKYPTSMYSWNYWNPSHKSMGRILSLHFRQQPYKYIRYVYFFRFLKTSKDINAATKGKIPCSQPQSYEIAVMEALCLACRPHDVVKISHEKADAQTELRRLAAYAEQNGTVATHALAFRPLKMQATVSILALAIETGGYVKHNVSAEEPFLLHLKTGGGDMDRATTSRQVVTRTLGPVLPESVVIFFLMKKYSNITFTFAGDTERLGTHVYTGSAEMIHGPGIPLKFIYRYPFATFTPVGFTRLRFITCANITVTERSGLLYKPFDRSTWTFLCISIGAVCSILQLTLKNRRNLAGMLPLFFMVFRILLDNFQDISSKLKRWPIAFAIATGSTALCAITLTNGYRGVLTSDLVMAPEISGPKTFRELLDDGGRFWWDFVPYSTSRIYNANESFAKKSQWLYVSMKVGEGANHTTEALTLKSEANTSLTHEDYEKIDYGLRRSAGMFIKSGIDKCPCDRIAFITMESNLFDLNLPPVCLQQMGQKHFVRGTDYLMQKPLRWFYLLQRPGPVWESLGRLLSESGLYDWLNRMLRHVRSDLVVNGQHIEVATMVKANRVVPLRMKTLIVESAFSLWGWMILVSVSIFILELAYCLIRASFSFR